MTRGVHRRQDPRTARTVQPPLLAVVDGAPVPVGRFSWERALRRLAVGKDLMATALVLATYANADGENAHPGEDVLAADLLVTDRTVRRDLARLMELGLIERTFRGSQAGRRKLADVYRLTLPPDPARTVGLTPDHPALGRPSPGGGQTWG